MATGQSSLGWEAPSGPHRQIIFPDPGTTDVPERYQSSESSISPVVIWNHKPPRVCKPLINRAAQSLRTVDHSRVTFKPGTGGAVWCDAKVAEVVRGKAASHVPFVGMVPGTW
jgi:hypothetical protein